MEFTDDELKLIVRALNKYAYTADSNADCVEAEELASKIYQAKFRI